jgi:hypothetical protein
MPPHCLKTHSAILACHLSGNWGSTRCAEWSHAGPILLHIAQNTSQPIEDTTALLNWIDIARGRGKVLLTSFCNFAAEWRLFVMWSCPLCEVNAASIWFTIILAQYTSHNGEAYNDSSQCMMYSLTILDWQHPSRIHSFCSWNIPICTTSLIWISMRSISKTAALLCGVIFCRILI